MILRKALFTLFVSAFIGSWSLVHAATYDVLKLPATQSELATKSLIFAIKKYGERYYAVGHQGHILYSDDGGDSWTQAKVPVRSSLLDIDFPTPQQGWAVGHEGVILHSSDAGETWVKQYDGIRYGEEGLVYYTKLSEENPDNDLYPYLVEEMEFSIGQGADKPLFRVHFQNEKFGHALGAYGMILVTRDGGESWQHALHTTENDSFYHVFDFAPLPEEGRYFLSGEAGLFMVGDINTSTAKKINSVPWEGSFFTSAATQDGAIVMGGLRGRMFRTEDVGDTWTVVEKPPTSSIVDSVQLSNGNILAVGIAGEVLRSTDNGETFSQLPVTNGGRIYAVSEGPAGFILVGGPKGIAKLELPQ